MAQNNDGQCFAQCQPYNMNKCVTNKRNEKKNWNKLKESDSIPLFE